MGDRSIRALGALGLVLGTAGFAPKSGPRIAADTLTAMPAAGVTKPLRLAPRFRYDTAAAPASWRTFISAMGGSWQAAWDVATGVPNRIWGSGVAVPGACNDPAIAEAAARRVLADHLALLAPGAAPADFELVSNVFDGDTRSVGFLQRANGHRVVGGQVSFRFKRDRLFVIASQALPNVAIAVPRVRLAVGDLAVLTTAALRAAVQLPAAPVRALGDDVVLPLVTDVGVVGYRLASPFEIDGGVDGRYVAYADVASGGIYAVRQLNEYTTGTLDYRGVIRWPGRGYTDRPAPRAHVTVDNAAQTTAPDGTVTWSSTQAAQIITAAVGDLVSIVNMSVDNRDAASAQLSLAPNGTASWDASATIEDDAQVQAYIDTNLAKEYVRAYLDPQLPLLDQQMVVNVNLNQECNAFFDGTALNFFHASPAGCDVRPNICCNNTALLQDVNFHEFGHGVHEAEIIEGVGAFDGAMSEGAADFLAASITGDSGMGRGFTYTDDPLRELDPPNVEYWWPNDISTDIHHTGMIFGGSFWDLRKAFIAQYGQTQGVALTNKLYLAAMRRATDIPSCFIEALAADDDDGNLANGTPHECLIRNAFAPHGLRTASGSIDAPATIDQVTLAIGVAIDLAGLSTCGGDALSSVTLSWHRYSNGNPEHGSEPAAQLGASHFVAQLPLTAQGTASYQAAIAFGDGTSMSLPDNLADPEYQIYSGPTVKLYCTKFEDGDPLAAGWTAGTADGSAPTWAWVEPSGGATNPHAAFSGTHILAQAPSSTYAPSQNSWVKTPLINTWPYSDVRLQYRRWLAVQDSHFDQARITANDTMAWINATANDGDDSALAHIDKEWRFHDVPLSGYFRGRTLTVGFELKADADTQLSGWSLDDVCIVANPNSICGDGVRATYEQCDDGAGNADVPDACRTDCRAPTCGDQIVDTSEDCDDGPDGSPTCNTHCKTIIPAAPGGCCDTGGSPAGSLALAALVATRLRRRRR